MTSPVVKVQANATSSRPRPRSSIASTTGSSAAVCRVWFTQAHGERTGSPSASTRTRSGRPRTGSSRAAAGSGGGTACRTANRRTSAGPARWSPPGRPDVRVVEQPVAVGVLAGVEDAVPVEILLAGLEQQRGLGDPRVVRRRCSSRVASCGNRPPPKSRSTGCAESRGGRLHVNDQDTRRRGTRRDPPVVGVQREERVESRGPRRTRPVIGAKIPKPERVFSVRPVRSSRSISASSGTFEPEAGRGRGIGPGREDRSGTGCRAAARRPSRPGPTGPSPSGVRRSPTGVEAYNRRGGRG